MRHEAQKPSDTLTTMTVGKPLTVNPEGASRAVGTDLDHRARVLLHELERAKRMSSLQSDVLTGQMLNYRGPQLVQALK
jgi:hypothetical protein